MAGFDPTTFSEAEIARLDLTVRGIAMGAGRDGMLAGFLEDPDVSADEKTYVIQQLARSPDNGAQMAFFSEDRAVIGPALEAAFNQQALSTDDLVGIARNTDFALINPSLQLVSMLSTDPDQPNSALAALSNHLVDPVNGLSEDEVTAGYIGLASDPDHLDRYIQGNSSLPPHANVPGRREIFERIVDFNDANGLPAGFDPKTGGFEAAGLIAAARMYDTDGVALIDGFAADRDTSTLAKFFAQGAVNPDAATIDVGGGRNIGQVVADVNERSFSGYLDKMGDETRPLEQRLDAAGYAGRLNGAMAGGVAEALTRYSEDVAQSEAAQKQFIGLVGQLSRIPGAKLPVQAITAGLNAFGKDAADDIPRPDQLMAAEIYREQAGRIETFESKPGVPPGFENAFTSAQSNELLLLQQSLNINLGGHREASLAPDRNDTATTRMASAGAAPDNHTAFERLAAAAFSGNDKEFADALAYAASTPAAIEQREAARAAADAQSQPVEEARRVAFEPEERARGPRMA
jgi:hypothetical protein